MVKHSECGNLLSQCAGVPPPPVFSYKTNEQTATEDIFSFTVQMYEDFLSMHHEANFQQSPQYHNEKFSHLVKNIMQTVILKKGQYDTNVALKL